MRCCVNGENKDGNRQTVDYGKREGNIHDRATGNHIRQGVSELRTSARLVLHPLGKQTGGVPVYSEKGCGLTRDSSRTIGEAKAGKMNEKVRG